MFSVVIPLYNKELSVTNTINSVLNQTFKEFEIIIVNDGSTDNSLAVVQKFNDPRIKIIDKSNGGVSSARNRGIEETKYEWICFLDADDLWDENHLSVLNDMINLHTENKVFCTSYIRSNQMLPTFQDASIIVIEDYFKEAIKGHFFWTSVACIHISVFDNVGYFVVNLNRGEDLELWTRIGREYSFIKSKLVTATYRVEAENRSDLSINLKNSRIYNYNFEECKNHSEFLYYQKTIIVSLRKFIKKKQFKKFWVLLKKHYKYIPIIKIFK